MTLEERIVALELRVRALDNLPTFKPLKPSTTSVAEFAKRLVVRKMDVALSEIESRSRWARIVWARQIAMFLTVEISGAGWTEVARAFNKKDHSTISHACKKVRNLMNEEPETKSMVTALLEAMKSFDT